MAFAGGGAKAIVHVGALKALEERNVDFCGVAGTSAGAIVAALKACGFSADDLVDTTTGRTLIDRLEAIDPRISRATDFFGRGGWVRVAIFRAAIDHPTISKVVAGISLVAVLAAGGVLIGVGQPWAGAAVYLMALIAAWFVGRVLIGGLADVGRFKAALGTLLQQKLFPDEPNRVVLMGDFGRDGRPPLKIVSANLSRRQLHLFSPHRTPETPLADAVAASICLPVVFAPWFVDKDLHVDGGIVSNLPAWPFDEERELDPEALTIAVEIATDPAADRLSRFSWLSAAVQTGLFGSGELNLRVSGQAERLLLSSSLELLEFDLSKPQIMQEVLDANRAASVRLDKRLFRLPQLYRDACGVTQGLVDDVISSLPGAGKGRTRVALALPDRDYYRSLRLRYSVGYADDHDEGLLLPLNGCLAGKAWLAGQSQFELAPLPAESGLPGHANRLRRKAQWEDLAWRLCIPIFEGSNVAPRFVVQIDGSGRLRQSRAVAAAVTQIERDVTDFFNLVIRELVDLEDDDGLGEYEFSEAGHAR